MENRIKVGIWGLGRAGMNMHCSELDKYPELYQLTAGMDISRERCRNLTEKYQCATYTDADAFLADPEVELVSVATRSTDHVEHALRALNAGKYVFLEKPIALNYADALKLVAADKQYPGRLFPRHNRRFEAPFNHIMEIIGSGVLGKIFEVKLRRHNYQRRNDWQTLTDCGGGQLNNWGPHIIDHALRFLDCPVKELWSDLKTIAAVGDAEDHLKIVLKGENNVVVDLEISGGVALPESEYLIFGTRGALSCTGDKIILKYLNPKTPLSDIVAESGNPPLDGGFGNVEKLEWIEETLSVAPGSKVDTHYIWQAMYDAIRNGVAFPITVEQGAEVVRITELVKHGKTLTAKP